MVTAAEIVGAVHTGRPLVRVRHSQIGEDCGELLMTQGVTQPLDMDVEGLETGRSLLLIRTHCGEPEWRLYVRRADTDPDVLPGTCSWAPETDWQPIAGDPVEAMGARADWVKARVEANLLTGRVPPKIAIGDVSLSGADFRVLRERLGVTTEWVARWMGVAERTVHRWDADVSRVPAGVSGALVRLDEWTAQTVAEVAARFAGIGAPVMWTYRTDADLRGVLTESGMSASWHRALAARVRDLVPGLRIEYLQP